MKIDKGKKAALDPGEVRDCVSPISFRVDANSGVPTYLQLVQQVEHALRLGYLQQGDQLPRVKDVVGSLSINPNTVLKAYRELEHKGITAGRPGQGTFIEATPETVEFEKLAELRRSLAQGWLREAIAAGLSRDEIVALMTVALRDATSASDATPYKARRARRSGEAVA
jgi:GntR family transcriptional regulator